MARFSVVFFVALLAGTVLHHQGVQAANGVDISDPTSKSTFECMKKSGVTFAIIRCWQSNGVVDANCPATAAAANEAGLIVELYMYPDAPRGNPAAQVDSFMAYVRQHNIRYGRVWLDIEYTYGGFWSSNHGTNQAFFGGLIAELRKQGQTIGVYTSASQWEPIMGRFVGQKSVLTGAFSGMSNSFKEIFPD